MRKFLLLLSLCTALYAQGPDPLQKPDLVLEGDVTAAQNDTHFFVPFTVPAGVHRLSVDFSYNHRQKEKTVFNIGIYDPAGFRGQSGSNKDHFTLGPGDATPSYIPGSITPGEWKLLISVSNIRTEITSRYRVEIRFNSPIEDSSFTMQPLETTQRWYRGDMHMHTGNSDGFCVSQTGKHVPCPVFLTAQAATNRGLDFIAITDHNSLAHYNEMRELQPYFDKLLLIPGREMTTFYGHFNMFGLTQYVDYLVAEKDGITIDQVVAQATKLGGIVSINHPESPTGEACRGCGWTPPGPTDLAKFTAIETVNSDRVMDHFYDAQAAKGLRLTAIGSSDNHDASKADTVQGAIAHPTTVVQAKELSVAAILNGIRAGHVFIDTTGSLDRMLDVDATAGSQTVHMGDNLKTKSGETVQLKVHVTACPGSKLQMIVDGKPSGSPMPIDTPDQSVTTNWTSGGSRHWLRFIVEDKAGTTQLLGNPVYINF